MIDAFDPVLKWLNGVAAILGADPKMIGTILCTAYVIRHLRASVEAFASGWMYAFVIVVGVAAGCTPWFGGTMRNPGAGSLAFIAMTLIVQRAMQGIAEGIEGWTWMPKQIKWLLPADNKFVKPPTDVPVGEPKP